MRFVNRPISNREECFLTLKCVSKEKYDYILGFLLRKTATNALISFFRENVKSV